ncbi:c-type cytochrome [Stenoxybacter acetivorans]|uniref:c-type cytochrome n=1 Tax=Stenoxybacter acetivorans TaxID=422441 RepID=UPI00056BCC58|nr:cytochrome c [Stenoxybacter acetivorans]
MKKIALLLTLATSIGLAACSGAPAEVAKGPNAEARTAAFKKMMPDFSSMGKMVKGEEAYDAEKFKAAAASFAQLSQEPFKHFTSDGEGKDGDSLPNIWTDAEKFKAEETKFADAVVVLNEKAQAGNLEEIKVAYGNTGATCKSCHDTFRRPK